MSSIIQKTDDNVDMLGQSVPNADGEIEPRASKYASLWVERASTIKTNDNIDIWVSKSAKAFLVSN